MNVFKEYFKIKFPKMRLSKLITYKIGWAKLKLRTNENPFEKEKENKKKEREKGLNFFFHVSLITINNCTYYSRSLKTL